MFDRDMKLKETSADNQWHPRHIDVIACFYVFALFITWVTAGKLFVLAGITLSASVFVYPLNAVFGDILTEIYGFNRTRRLMWTGLFCGFMYIFFTQLAIHLPPSPDYKLQEAFAVINDSLPRIVIASYIAYVFCELTNSWVMSKMKVKQQAHNFPLRAVASTAAAQFVDSLVFFGIAFAGVMPVPVLVSVIISSWIAKTIYEFLALPLTTFIVKKLKAFEGIEHFDRYKLKMLKF
ncbi:MAG: queuosine precursor transporter [Alphaproteobacteria bacterium]|nr:queuosine precursor transporter [Alphaproteobacteria bacterium]